MKDYRRYNLLGIVIFSVILILAVLFLVKNSCASNGDNDFIGLNDVEVVYPGRYGISSDGGRQYVREFMYSVGVGLDMMMYEMGYNGGMWRWLPEFGENPEVTNQHLLDWEAQRTAKVVKVNGMIVNPGGRDYAIGYNYTTHRSFYSSHIIDFYRNSKFSHFMWSFTDWGDWGFPYRYAVDIARCAEDAIIEVWSYDVAPGGFAWLVAIQTFVMEGREGGYDCSVPEPEDVCCGQVGKC
jgi:hypothetical protein